MAPGKREQAAATREALIAAAADEFAEAGFAGAKLENIARRAGFTRGALYWNFSGKEELLHAVLDRASALGGDPSTAPGESTSPEELDARFRALVADAGVQAHARTFWLLAIELALHGIRRSPQVRDGFVRRFRAITRQREPELRARLGHPDNLTAERLELLGRVVQALEDGFLLQFVLDPKTFPIEGWADGHALVMDALAAHLGTTP